MDRANSNRLTRSLTTMSGTVEESQSNFSGQNGIVKLVMICELKIFLSFYQLIVYIELI